jgi:two-component system, chemotaxis family, sensor kinase CheA
MDELLSEFLTETTEHLEGVETQLLQFERDPSDATLVAGIFRLVHTIKGTSSFLGLTRLQTVAHAAETLLGDLRDGVPPTPEGVSLILGAIDRIKSIMKGIEGSGAEPEGSDADLITKLEAASAAGGHGGETAAAPAPAPAPTPMPSLASEEPVEEAPPPPPKKKAAPKAEEQSQGEQSQQRGSAAPRSTETIRVAVDTIERIMQLVSELVLNRNQLLEITRNRENDPVKSPLQRLSGLTTDLQDAVMRARMQPVGRLYSSLPRLMRELCAELNKKINLVTDGADTELDRQLIEVLRDPLTHMLRNCADHGVETPEERIAAGKPEYGEIRVSAAHEAGQINIDIADDGRGLNLERIKQKAIDQGLATEEQVELMSTEEICRFIFSAGFSTAAKVTSVSGRGVGMDVVRSNIESIGGSVSLSSVYGKGTRFSLKIPLTLAIAPALIVQVGKERFALPQHSVVEVVGMGADSRNMIEKVQDALVLRLREEVVPVLDLASILGFDPQTREEENAEGERLVVIIRIGSETFGVCVDAVLDVQEIVVKPLNASLAHLKVFSGETILGDGSVVLILDPGGIGAALGIEKSADNKRDAKDSHGAADHTRLVLFRSGDGLPKVLPLSLLARIEMVEPDRIERSDGRYVMLHQGRLMPLLPTAPMQDVSDKPHPVLVITANNHTIGLLVDEIIDIVEEKLDVQLASYTDDMVGSAEIKGKAVELIDVTYYLQAAYSSLYRQEVKEVLLAEEDLFFRDTLKPVLAGAGYKVTTVSSAAQLIDLMQQRKGFDAVLIDTDMETSDGGNLADYVRASLVKPETPIFRLFELPPQSLLGLATDDRMTVNLSKLDRQGLLSNLASVLAAQDEHTTSQELAA